MAVWSISYDSSFHKLMFILELFDYGKNGNENPIHVRCSQRNGLGLKIKLLKAAGL